ncbi:unnamed protein product [Linum tenue]|uniref:Protein kinase domain-containing protein n=1 Tax=Linum tenue TaxID=586396 RepID=A0AAV0IUD7_9ROSI|nr:unnamed protein product [Linum tenue]
MPIPALPPGSILGVRGKDYTPGIAIGVAVGIGSCFVILLLGRLGLFIFWRNKTKADHKNSELVSMNGARNIPREAWSSVKVDLELFIEAMWKILKCSSRSKGCLEEQLQGVQDYANEIMTISQLRHKNLVQLIGWCHENRELLLVYEYMENRSLGYHIFDEERCLDWNKRYRGAQGLTSILHYLHEECNQCVLHRDIKANNVMLAAHFDPKLGDFGLARLVDHDVVSQTLPGGTRGYMAPICLGRGKTSKETNVYGFGVVALEIATGRDHSWSWKMSQKAKWCILRDGVRSFMVEEGF